MHAITCNGGYTMDKTYTDKIINQYISKLSKTEEPDLEYRIICAGLANVYTGNWHIDVDIFRRSSNHFSLFYKIDSNYTIGRR
jgi:hypothetical protein